MLCYFFYDNCIMVSDSNNNIMSTLYPITVASVTTAAFMYPIDVMRAIKMSYVADTRNLITIPNHYKKFGIRGFVSKGMLPEIAKSSVMRISKFYLFPIGCSILWSDKPQNCSSIQKGIAGAIITIPEIIMISPLEVAKMGIQMDHKNLYKNNSINFIKHQYKIHRINGLYVGWAGMQWRQCFWSGTYFSTLSWWKSKIEPIGNSIGIPTIVNQFIAGFLAGSVATIPNTPGDVVRSVVQKRLFGNSKLPAYGISVNGVLEHANIAKEIIYRNGIQGLYSGIGLKALHLGGSGALMAIFIPIFSNLMKISYDGV